MNLKVCVLSEVLKSVNFQSSFCRRVALSQIKQVKIYSKWRKKYSIKLFYFQVKFFRSLTTTLHESFVIFACFPVFEVVIYFLFN